jgi:hypothetical protein
LEEAMSEKTPMSEKTAYNLARLILLGMFVQLLVIGYVFFQAYDQRVTLVDSQRHGCERGKLDRKDNADFQTAQTNYILVLTDTTSVGKDVKDAANVANKTYLRTSKSLTERSKIDCKEAFPDAQLLP